MRTRLNGQKFESEFEKEALRQGCWCKRIRTQQTKYAGVDESADYYFATPTRAFYLELKETTKDSFSLYTMRQREKAEEVVDFKSQCPTSPLGFLLVVHFIAHQAFYYQEIVEKPQPRKTVKPNLPIKLKELVAMLKES